MYAGFILSLISPGVFIPLFEDTGLIRKLDAYVWEEAARQIRVWKDNFDFSVPVSVNVSRIDLFDANLMTSLQKMLDRHGLTSKDLHLEVTESAYTQDSEQIIQTVEQLRNIGFQIEMDDFGSGYSSLNMLSALPIDALKLDMQFIRNAFKPGGNVHLLEIIIDIAAYLAVPVIAEGVETEAQLDMLKEIGCDIVQGYFFSKPVPARDFEPFILQRKEADKAFASTKPLSPAKASTVAEKRAEKKAERKKAAQEQLEQTGTSEPPAPVDPGPGINLGKLNIVFVLLAFFAAVALFLSDLSVTSGYQRMERASDRYISAQMSASNLEFGSDFMTDCVR